MRIHCASSACVIVLLVCLDVLKIAKKSFVGTVSTCSWCPRENLRQLLGELVARLSLKSVLRFCIGHQEGSQLGIILTDRKFPEICPQLVLTYRSVGTDL